MNDSAVSTNLVRSNLWSSELKEILRDEMQAQRYVRMLEGFPDGDTFNIPQIGTIGTNDYVDDQAGGVTYDPLTTSNFTFTVDKYLTSATYITKQAQQDSFYAAQLEARFAPEQARAILEHFETTTFAAPESGLADNASVAVNSIAHRISGGNGGKIELADFAYARYALKKASTPDRGLVAIVDPSVEFQLNTLSNIVGVANNPMFEGIVRDGIATGMRFVANVYGFDVYTSNFLPSNVNDTALAERDGTTTNAFNVNNGVANYFFTTEGDANPFVGAWRQMPEVDYEYNKDRQRHEYVTSARYGVKKYRDETMVTVVTDPNV